jgi:hypothetical protein
VKAFKLVFVFCLFMFNSIAQAGDEKTYHIDLDLFQGSKKIFSPSVTVKQGEPALVTQQDGKIRSFIEVVVVEGVLTNVKGILLKVIAGTINSNGTRTILAKPELIVAENELTKISTEKSYENLSVNIVASRKDLN